MKTGVARRDRGRAASVSASRLLHDTQPANAGGGRTNVDDDLRSEAYSSTCDLDQLPSGESSAEDKERDANGYFHEGDALAAGSPEEHIATASKQHINFFSRCDLDKEICRNIKRIVAGRDEVMVERDAASSYWEAQAEALEPVRVAWRANLPERTREILGKLHYPLIVEMLECAGHEDASFLDDLQRGFPVAGPIDAGGIGIPNADGRLCHGKPAHGVCPELETLRLRCAEVNAASIRQAQPGLNAAAVWAKHKQEVLEGKVGPPVPLDRIDLSQVLLAERFGVDERRSGSPKVRVIDNFRRNSVNAHSSLLETSLRLYIDCKGMSATSGRCRLARTTL